MDVINEFIKKINDIVWGVPLMVLIMAVGLILTFRLGVLQVFHLPKALCFMVKDEEDGEGEVSSFGSLCTALSATIGTGNIVGVATAIGLGGPGALFWMWLAAFLGMATKYAEGLLAVKYRSIDAEGHVLGGPFYYIERGMGAKWKWLAKLFAFFGVCVGLLGIGTFAQINGITSALQCFFDPNLEHTVSLFGGTYSVSVVIGSLFLAPFAAFVIIGGMKRIASVTEYVVPIMAIVYVVFALILLCINFRAIPTAFGAIFQGAFSPSAVTGGAVGSMFIAMQKGVARGIFSNESGLGSAPIAAAAARTKEPVRQGLVSMTGTFIDTIVICTMTGLCIVVTGAWNVSGLEGVGITNYAFTTGLPWHSNISSFVLSISLVFFAFTTILGWNYYAERCLEYLSGGKKVVMQVFRWLYIFAVLIGPYMTVSLVWNVADVFNGLMAFPNLIALFALQGVVVKETKTFFDKNQS